MDAAFCESNEFINALSLTNIDESLLEKIVRKRGTCSSRRSYSHLPFRSQPELKRCGTFPSPRLAGLGVSEDNEAREKYDDTIPDTFAPVVVPRIKVNDKAIEQCKDMKAKVKFITSLNDKKEKQRIAMDGVLDKIPKDREGVSDETKREMFGKWAKKNRSGHKKEVDPGKNGRRYFKRTASLDDSNMGRYCQLFESFNKEIKHHDMNIRKPEEQDTCSCLPDKRSLNRILSLPDFGSCSFRSEDSGHNSTDLNESNYEEQRPIISDVIEPTMEHLNSEGV